MHHTTTAIPLPFVPTPPAPAELEASASASPLLASLHRLRDLLGSAGRELSETGGLRLDGIEALELVGLRDVALPGTSEVVNPDPRPRCALLVAVADRCGAIDTVDDRLVAVPGWDDEDPIVLAATALGMLIELGPMSTAVPQPMPFLQLRDMILDQSIVHWLVTLLPDERSQTVDHFANWAGDACREQIGYDPFEQFDTPGEFETWVDNGTCMLVDLLEWAGAVEWYDRTVHTTEILGGARWIGGGAVRLTALGRYVVPEHLAAAGIRTREPDDPEHPSAAALLGDLIMGEDDESRRRIVESWRPDLDDAERARLVAAELVDDGPALWRQVGFEALAAIGPGVAEPFVRELLDSPASEDAAQFLVDHGLATDDQVRQFRGYGPLIGLFASLANEPERLKRWFIHLLERVPEPDLLLQVFALYRTHEATLLLTAAARHVTDPRFAGMIRAAEALHHEILSDSDDE